MKRALLTLVLMLALVPSAMAESFKVGFAQRDVTPTYEGMPMWGYGDRHALPATGTMDPLLAKAVVIDTGEDKIAIVGLDLGRSPTFRSMKIIRGEIMERADVNYIMISGSHTHHGPVIELIDEEGMGKGKYDNSIQYVTELEDNIVAAVVEASESAVDAKIGWNSRETDFPRNRHTKIEPKPVDKELAVIRFDDLEGKTIAVLANMAAHPTTIPSSTLEWSADWPGHMQRAAEAELGAPVFYMQGAAGDLSANKNESRPDTESFGAAVGLAVAELAKAIDTQAPADPEIAVIEDTFHVKSRLDFNNKALRGILSQAFFPEMMAMLEEIPDNTVTPKLVTVVLNRELALVGGSGEFFCAHANRLKEESTAKETFFFGYCNGHQMYFPTRAAIEEGGYGADQTVSWVAPGTGERMIDRALANIAELLD